MNISIDLLLDMRDLLKVRKKYWLVQLIITLIFIGAFLY